MKLLELVGVKKFYDVDIDNVLNSMKDSHTEIGRGSFAVTLKHTTKPGVVKFWIKDSSYDDFINYVVAHPYRHFPMLYSKPKMLSSFFLRPIEFPEKIKYVKMEELRHSGSSDDYIVDNIFIGLKKLKSIDLLDDFIDHLDISLNEEWLNRLKKIVPDVHEFCYVMYDMLNHVLVGSNRLDIHSENIMLRSNGELVITDPIYNSKDLDDSREIRSILKMLKHGSKEIPTVKGKTPRKTTT